MSNTTPFAATTNLRTEAETADIDTEVDSSAVLVSTSLQKGGTLKKNTGERVRYGNISKYMMKSSIQTVHFVFYAIEILPMEKHTAQVP